MDVSGPNSVSMKMEAKRSSERSEKHTTPHYTTRTKKQKTMI